MTFLNLSLGRPVVRAAETITGDLGVVGARFIVAGGPSEGRFSLVEHPIVPDHNKRHAGQIGVVRLSDGRVEVRLEGDAAAVDRVAAALAVGPPAARW